ncbi:putative transcription initiation factor TFIID, subunit 5 [Cryptosporidium serpentis]
MQQQTLDNEQFSMLLELLKKQGCDETLSIFMKELEGQTGHNKCQTDGETDTFIHSKPLEYNKAYYSYSRFKDWVMNSLDNTREELFEVCYIVFVYIYLGLLKSNLEKSKEFFNTFSDDFMLTRYRSVLTEMRNLTSIDQLEYSETTRPYRKSKFHIILRTLVVSLLESFLVSSKDILILSILQNRLIIHFSKESLGTHSSNGGPTKKSCDLKRNSIGKINYIKAIGTVKVGELYTQDMLEMDIQINTQTKEINNEMLTLENSNNEDMFGKSIGINNNVIIWGLFPESYNEGQLKEAGLATKRLDNSRLDGEVTEELKDPIELKNLIIPDTNSIYSNEYKRDLLIQIANRVELDHQNLPSIICNTIRYPHSEYITDMDVSHNMEIGAYCTEEGCVQAYNIKQMCLNKNSDTYLTKRHFKRTMENVDVINQEASDLDPLNLKNNLTCWLHKGRVQATRFNPWNSTLLLSCGIDSTIKLSMILDKNEKLTCLASYKGHSNGSCIWDIQWDKFGISFVSSGGDRTARYWCTGRTFPLRIFSGHLGDVYTCCIHPNNCIIGTGSTDGTVCIWDVRSSSKVGIINKSVDINGSVNCLKFSPNGQFIAFSSFDLESLTLTKSNASTKISLHDIRKINSNEPSSKLCELNLDSLSYIKSLDFSYGSKLLVAGTNDGVIGLWDTKGMNSQVLNIYKLRSSYIKSVKFLQTNILTISAISSELL